MEKPVSKKVLLMFLSLLVAPIMVYADPVWIDVRTEAEHRQDSIDGDLLIPHNQIVEQVSRQFPDKDTDIHLYCLSGGRAEKARSALEDAGYTRVKNTGGIEDARAARDL
ncbi:rhodanese-like domain-containing protein [Marinobacter sp. CHS3-4]|uniref:rhodanese-like domain-containing protein n=1 Tax=Marinobacter sp. CHS3-4 TaxID=3045174 RepID=UPI0024B5022D|nr:rhodanese-like domain-containing protein [Marinobacter sp. CHS3-4]MDI9244662.1 rhodanese-like domain-containing protein [Marinobacter sp. CHS3-4]